MCYREDVPPLSFESFHVACLAGDNGHGKSALLDAMTWALGGKSRASSDDDLVNQGKTDMEVEYLFAIGEQRYRVIRKHVKAGPKRSVAQAMELQIAGPEGFKPLTGASNRETQQKLTGLLRMDYDTFINSAFLRQGHADEFTVANPSKRKQVLADILGLSFYDELEEQAKELAKQRETEEAQLDSAIKDINDELAQKPVYEAELGQALGELSHIEKIIKEQESRLNELRQKKESLENKRIQLTQLETAFGKVED
jgi:exonuclease SbcC